MAKKPSLRPVVAMLKEIRKELELESECATTLKKKSLKDAIKRIDNLIAKVPPACKNKYSMG